MRKHAIALGGAGLMLGVSLLAVQAQDLTGELPDPPEFSAQSEPNFVSVSDIQEYKALPEYHEPDWVTAKYVEADTPAGPELLFLRQGVRALRHPLVSTPDHAAAA